VYDTLVRMAQDFSMRYPLIDGQGNFGSIDGDPPAAYRYTECRLDRLGRGDAGRHRQGHRRHAAELRREERRSPPCCPRGCPTCCSTAAPASPWAWPPTSRRTTCGELVDALTHLIDNPEATVDDLMKFIQGPDFPTGGVICGNAPIRQMYETGRGLLKVRGAPASRRTPQGKDRIIITEIPYTVNKARR
jgi:DNA gyrase subunit A